MQDNNKNLYSDGKPCGFGLLSVIIKITRKKFLSLLDILLTVW